MKQKETQRMPSDEDDQQLALLEKELEASLERNRSLEKKNEQLKQEVARLKAQICSLKVEKIDRKSELWKKLQTSKGSNHENELERKPIVQINIPEETPAAENMCPGLDYRESEARKKRPTRIPRPPPRPTSATPSLPQELNGRKVPPVPAPPPPPPLPSKLQAGPTSAVRRVPEVMEFYRSLTRRDASIDNRTSLTGIQLATNARNMIGEIENRSTYLLAIKSDVETQGEFIRFLTKEVEDAAYTEISDVEAFVKWLDSELSYLVDERAVLKHFPQWPERKADAMREAAFSFRDLKNIEFEVSSFRDNPKQPIILSLKRMQALQDRLERSVHNTERMRESASKRYREFHIPWEWMLDSGLINQWRQCIQLLWGPSTETRVLKLCSMRLAKECMKRVTIELQTNECSQKEDLVLQGVRFAFRVHQFAGGFDAEAMQAFEELRKVGNDCHGQLHTVSAPKLY